MSEVSYMRKIIGAEELERVVRELREQGKSIVFTNGCFDLLHVGHVRYLAEAKGYGDVLIVGLNSDESVRRLKGPKRPIVPEGERAEMLAALESVDYVVIFEEDTPERLIRMIRPDVHVKGGDYRPDEVLEAPLVRELGGEVRIAQYVDGKSTTVMVQKIVERMRDGECGGEGQ